MSLDSTAPSAASSGGAVSGATLTRSSVERLIAAWHAGEDRNHAPLQFTDCDFEGADLSRLDLRGVEFERCTIRLARMSRCVSVQSAARSS
jgi:uncharacterized protein YjbI with pentapeptide repeats